MFTGVDYFLTEEIVESRVVLTNMRGIHAVPVAETAMAMMLMFSKQSLLCFQSKLEKRWEDFIPETLRAKTVGIVGLGSIGKEIARLAKAFGMKVIAVDEARGNRRARNVDTMLPVKRLRELFLKSDFVVAALPLTPGTNKMIGEEELKCMKTNAYFINVGRGATVDEEALIRVLEKQEIAGAGIDAFTTEPLPINNRLWDLPNVIISPHIGGKQKNYFQY